MHAENLVPPPHRIRELTSPSASQLAPPSAAASSVSPSPSSTYAQYDASSCVFCLGVLLLFLFNDFLFLYFIYLSPFSIYFGLDRRQ